MPKDDENETDMDDDCADIVYLTHMKELDEIQILIDQLNFEEPFTAEEFIQYDDSESQQKYCLMKKF